MPDRYTKAVLTVIAGALCALVVQNAVGPASAVGQGCGQSRVLACWVMVTN